MQNGDQKRTRGDDHDEAAIQGVKPGKELARARLRIVHGPHAARSIAALRNESSQLKRSKAW